MEELGHYINGAIVKGTSGRFTDVFNPATGEVQAKVPLASVEEIDAAVAKAARGSGGLGCYESPAAGTRDDGLRTPHQ